jgi:hypothetical protein
MGRVRDMCEGEREECIRDICRNSEAKRSLGLHRRRLEDTIQIDLRNRIEGRGLDSSGSR